MSMRVNNGNDVATSYENLLNFGGSVTTEFTEVVEYTPVD